MLAKTVRTSLGAAFLAISCLSAVAAFPLSSLVERATLADVLQLGGNLFHVQGLALEPTRIWATSVDNTRHKAWLHEFDRATGKALRRIELTDGARYHPGGISVADGVIWVPLAEMRPNSTAVIVGIDSTTLKVRRQIAVADHLGCVAVSGRKLVAGNWDSRLLYEFDTVTGVRVKVVPNPSQTRYQDIKFVGHHLVAGGNRDWLSGTVDWIDWRSQKLVRTLKAGAIGPVRPFGRGGPLTGEGMAIEGRDLYLLPEDGPSRLFRYRLTI
ncbi:MAG: hypothetical protein B7Y36_12790 [Novosphingobium sp. 28-62-57]|uniref:DUF6454 family protein n=1 Tax=unclassified Novosphingobium TaxID=2644732 RepID=UPI000BC922C1|nr:MULTISPECIES: DUF6454 family protein [unclassified Novosphingobium]OYW49146.1 MAG: hypothetical protein B7Z34_10140 [Novosphingobium sp. 12-62-10]OYZ09826.1 MAG: hypothetical protein B7Y36_12790 [Novosphingobium sp. 28-62-57]OZA37475.1 MAG: hypothetical protein B7X92_04730 [Novosphingobium sp. 17-62-9]HQS69048.1 DUF6454 family protein [Novosphingobium sp.]